MQFHLWIDSTNEETPEQMRQNLIMIADYIEMELKQNKKNGNIEQPNGTIIGKWDILPK